MQKLIWGAAVMALLTCSLVPAQTLAVRANIPFGFRVGDTPMPAGEYTMTHERRVLVVRETGGDHKAVQILTIGAYRNNRPSQGLLEFKRYGDSYFLSKVWTGEQQNGAEIPATKREKEAARNATEVQTVSIDSN